MQSPGYHPWFSYAIATQPFASKRSHYQSLLLGTSESPDLLEAFEKLFPHLPEPRQLDDVVQELRDNLRSFPEAMLGEVGLDRSFRIPIDYFSSPRELTPFTIPLEHQLSILEAQLDLATDLGRNVSLHSVKCQQATTALLSRMRSRHGERWSRISIDFHSCGFSPEMWQSIEAGDRHFIASLISNIIAERASQYISLVIHNHQRQKAEPQTVNSCLCTR